MTRVAILAAALAYAAVPPAAPAADSEALSIIARAAEAHGGAAALRKFPAGKVRIKGTAQINGDEVSFTGESAYLLPDQRRSALRFDVPDRPTTVVHVWDGTQALASADGRPTTPSPAARAEIRQSVHATNILHLTPLLDDPRYDVVSAGKSIKVRGKEAVGTIVKTKGEHDTILWFDKKSYLLLRIDRRGLDPSEREGRIEEYVTDYKTFAGLPRPSRFEVLFEGKRVAAFEVADFQPLERIDAKELSLESGGR